jgi:hypothetical protein
MTMGLYSWFTAWWLRPSRFTVRRWEQTAREGEEFIADYEFPAYLRRRVERHEPRLGESWELVELGLREWFVCCAWRGATVLGMPSRAVDEAWHEFILDSIAYTRFCNAAFGAYLHHTPDEGMSAPMPEALLDTVRAWDRSAASDAGDSILWNLDRRLGIHAPLGLGPRPQRRPHRPADPRRSGPCRRLRLLLGRRCRRRLRCRWHRRRGWRRRLRWWGLRRRRQLAPPSPLRPRLRVVGQAAQGRAGSAVLCTTNLR